ncbi:hypothetical protein QTI66_31065 [Variovorax sp. J22R133]|uniref:hypothetical protein n=1 Tax=Variovorax brevis TaxID=3053503 RepID=UPI002574C5D1|nr:hypothetical protein [Variovorax sp. J22R133]MDM0116588.1 hypothetical protein [Variovorax sp. J22R133]
MNAATMNPGEPATTSRSGSFDSLVELASPNISTLSAEICDACNTINMGSACYCKCCSQKLPAFYACTKDNAKSLDVRETVLPWHPLRMPVRASMMDFAAFAVVINLLVVVTVSITANPGGSSSAGAGNGSSGGTAGVGGAAGGAGVGVAGAVAGGAGIGGGTGGRPGGGGGPGGGNGR